MRRTFDDQIFPVVRALRPLTEEARRTCINPFGRPADILRTPWSPNLIHGVPPIEPDCTATSASNPHHGPHTEIMSVRLSPRSREYDFDDIRNGRGCRGRLPFFRDRFAASDGMRDDSDGSSSAVAAKKLGRGPLWIADDQRARGSRSTRSARESRGHRFLPDARSLDSTMPGWPGPLPFDPRNRDVAVRAFRADGDREPDRISPTHAR